MSDGRRSGGGTMIVVALVAFAAGRCTAPGDPQNRPEPQAASATGPVFVPTPVSAGGSGGDRADGPDVRRLAETSDVHEEPPPPPVVSEESAYYANCSAARAAGAAPLRVGDPGYAARLDRDRDGVACE